MSSSPRPTRALVVCGAAAGAVGVTLLVAARQAVTLRDNAYHATPSAT